MTACCLKAVRTPTVCWLSCFRHNLGCASVLCYCDFTTNVRLLHAGTVCILGEASPEAEAAVQRIVTRYRDSTGHSPHEFRGSSAGAASFGHLLLRRRQAL